MADIGPALYERIMEDYEARLAADRQIAAIRRRIAEGKAAPTDHHAFAQAAGESLARALTGTLTPEALPNGLLYYNIGEKTLRPALQVQAERVNEAGIAIQASLDAEQGVSIKPIAAQIPEDRISGLVDKAAEAGAAYQRWLGEPVINFSEHMADAFARENAAFRSSAGYRQEVRRILAPRCCDWCADVAGAGSYDYGKEPEGFWRRHEYCRCVVIVETGRGRLQNAWTKETYQAEPETMAAREAAGSERPYRLSPEDARRAQEQMLQRDNAIRQIMREENTSRTRAAAIYNRRRAEGIV